MRAQVLIAALAAGWLLLSVGAARGEPWEVRAPMLEARQEVAVAELDGRMYVVGGFRASPPGTQLPVEPVATVEVYDPATDTWEFVAPLPTPLHHTAAVGVDGRLYVMGGWPDFFATVIDTVFVYDPSEDEWDTRAPMPTARAGLAVAELDGILYAAGGMPPERESDFAAYDPVADEWTPLPAMPTPRNHLGLVALADRIFAVAGRSGTFFPIPGTGALEAYDPALGAWEAEPRTPMPTSRSGVAAAAFEGRLLVFGGEGGSPDPSGVFQTVEAYDPDRDTWRSLPPMPTGRHGMGAAVLADGVHVPGGGPVEGFGLTDVHEVFVPEPGAAPAALAVAATLAILARLGPGAPRGRAPRSRA